ncbi:hypothetical protein LP420_11525 [Massilia sp. B-10]|nr:hypothetical protein LP420_11525 [Massilia sp. B-10]
MPYMWYGFGTGGLQQRYQEEGITRPASVHVPASGNSSAFYNPATGRNNAAVDLNGDGDTLDRVIVANSSVTKTFRPGITSSLTWTLNNHEILGGFWYERARHQQTGTMVKVAPDGQPVDYFLQDGAIRRPDGSLFQSRDWMTISTAYQAFLQDTISFMDDKIKVNVGVRIPHINRDFTNNASEGNTKGTNNPA